MSTSTLICPQTTSPPDSPPAADTRLTFARVVRSEWIKFRTLRSTIWTLAITLVLMVGIWLCSQQLAPGSPMEPAATAAASW
jgi:ABC-2 type transport system permease protein